MTWENRLIFEVSSADPNAEFPVWVDFSTRVLDHLQPVTVQIGRQNDLDQSEPSRCEVLLNNNDDALTFGNTTSPYAAWWGPGRRCRLRDTVNGASFTLMTGFIAAIQEVAITAGVEGRVAVSIVDRLARLEASPRFVSTLTEYIRYAGGPALKAYWPLGDLNGPAMPVVGGTPLRGEVDQDVTGTSPDSTSVSPSIAFGNETPPPGEDLPALTFIPQSGGGATVFSERLTGLLAPAISLAVGQVLTLVAWVNIDAGYSGRVRFARLSSSSAPSLVDIGLDFGTPTPFTAAGQGNGWGFSFVDGGAAYIDAWILVAARMGTSPDTCELWVGPDRYTAAMAVAGPSTTTFDTVTLGIAFPGSLAHVQVYVGTASEWDRTSFLAQRQMGLLGLERQPTGDRIRTIAQYAGLPNVDTANTIDPGQSVMQRAQLAGKTPLDAMREAEATEQGLLHTDADGRLVFKDRRTLYNI